MATAAFLRAGSNSPYHQQQHHHHGLFRDRTSELRSIFDLLKQNSTPSVSSPQKQQQQQQQQQQNSSESSNNNNTSKSDGALTRKTAVQQQSEELRRFNDASSRFSVDLAQLAGTVANLTRLTQNAGGASLGSGGSTSAFEENSQEISRLTQVVRSRLGQLHDDLTSLAELKEAYCESSSSNPNNSLKKHNDAVVSALRSKLVGAGNNFKQLLQKRTKDIKDASMRRSKLLADRTGPAFQRHTGFADQQQNQQQESEGEAASGMSSSSALVAQGGSLEYLKQRQQAVHEIELAVREVGDIVNDFQQLVYEQDETIIRIDNDVDESLVNVNAGSNELMKYLASLASQRGFILKVMAVLFFFLMFFGFFIVR